MPVLRSIRERFAAERPLDGRQGRGVPARHGRDRQPDARRWRPAAQRSPCARPTRCPPRTTWPRRWRGTGSRSAPPRRGPRRLRRATSPRSPGRAADHARRRRRPARHAARARPELLEGLLGGTEETTTGLVRLRALQAEGSCACPVLAVNEARTERVVQRPLRHRAVDARRHPARHEPAAGRQTVVVARLRLHRPRRRRRAHAAPAPRWSSARSTRCARSRRGWTASRSCPRWRPPSAATCSSRSPARAACCGARTSSG